MRRVDQRLGLSAFTVAPSFGRREKSGAARPAGRVPLLELLVVGVLVMVVASALIVSARQQVSQQRAQVTMSVTSDPSGASVIVDDLWVGRTPLEVSLTRSQGIALRVEAREPYLEYDLYKPFRTRLTIERDRNLHVWIQRTTAEEQARQLADGR